MICQLVLIIMHLNRDSIVFYMVRLKRRNQTLFQILSLPSTDSVLIKRKMTFEDFISIIGIISQLGAESLQKILCDTRYHTDIDNSY